MNKMILTAAIAAAIAGVGASAQAHGPVRFTGLVTNGNLAATNGGGELNITGGATYNTSVTGWNNSGYNFVFTPGTLTSGVPTAQYGNSPLAIWGYANGGQNVVGAPPSGGNVVAMDGDYQVGAFSQVLTGVTAGEGVKVSFWNAFGQQYGFDGDTIQSISVSLGGAPTTRGLTTVQSHGFTGWNLQTVYFTAPTDSPTLSFLAHGNLPVPPFALIAGISAVGTAVPEPTTWAIMLVGLGGLGALARRRRAISAVAA